MKDDDEIGYRGMYMSGLCNKLSFQIQLADKLMIAKSTSKNWNDFSEEDSEEEEEKQQGQAHSSHAHAQKQQAKEQYKQQYKYMPTQQQIGNQVGKLKELDYNKIDEVWLEITSEDTEYLLEEVDYLKSIARKNGDVVSVQSSKFEKNVYDVLVYIVYAYDIIEEGYDKFKRMKVVVSQRNFEKRQNERAVNRRQKDYREKGGFEKQGERKKYVDKQTGREPSAKKQYEEKGKTSEGNQRIYSKEEAGRKGEDLGAFKNKVERKEEEGQQARQVVEGFKVSKKTSAETEAKQGEKIVEEAVRQEKTKQIAKEKNENKKGKGEEKKSKKSKVSKVKSLNPYEGIQNLD